MTLSHRKNLLNIWKRHGIDFAPAQIRLCPSLEKQFKDKYGDDFSADDFADSPYRPISRPHVETLPPESFMQFYPDNEFSTNVDISWLGVAYEKTPSSMHMSRRYHPMLNFDSLEQFKDYPYPILRWEDNQEALAKAKQEVSDLNALGLASFSAGPIFIWEMAWNMRGMMELMMDMTTGDKKAVYHLDRMTEISCFLAGFAAKAGVDVVHLGDDIGMQKTIMMSPEMYREWLKPRLRKVIKTAKDAKPDILVAYHSCGYIEPYIPDLIEVGVDVLHPVQPECMDFAKIHAEYGDVLSFWGTIGTQTTMPFGTPQDVKDCVKRNLDIAGSKGGLLCAPSHMLEPEVPLENIEAYITACREWS
ncbi:MAG: hypothetical protein L3J71_15685 [Victivallaceae bacterium]|nr:hypothetical protein [Victivallaceae bacterium]